MRWAVIFIFALAGCSERESAKLARQYEIMKTEENTPDQLCQKARQVANAFLAEENADEYRIWNVTANLACNQARIDRL